MQPPPQRGKLVTWNDDRGFGFLQTEETDAKVFIHISAVANAARRPQLGDTIVFEKQTQMDGKVRAVNASILGVRTLSRVGSESKNPLLGLLGASVVIVGIVIWLQRPHPSSYSSTTPMSSFSEYDRQEASLPPQGYTIKGNISVETGRKIYHVPGGMDYEDTKIDPARGERWFRTEAEAVANGWRKATQ